MQSKKPIKKRCLKMIKSRCSKKDTKREKRKKADHHHNQRKYGDQNPPKRFGGLKSTLIKDVIVFINGVIAKKMVMDIYINKGQVPLKVISLPVKSRHLYVYLIFHSCSSFDFLPTFNFASIQKIFRPMQSSLSCKSQEMVIRFFSKLLQVVNRHVVGSKLKCFGRRPLNAFN